MTDKITQSELDRLELKLTTEWTPFLFAVICKHFAAGAKRPRKGLSWKDLASNWIGTFKSAPREWHWDEVLRHSYKLRRMGLIQFEDVRPIAYTVTGLGEKWWARFRSIPAVRSWLRKGGESPEKCWREVILLATITNPEDYLPAEIGLWLTSAQVGVAREILLDWAREGGKPLKGFHYIKTHPAILRGALQNGALVGSPPLVDQPTRKRRGIVGDPDVSEVIDWDTPAEAESVPPPPALSPRALLDLLRAKAKCMPGYEETEWDAIQDHVVRLVSEG